MPDLRHTSLGNIIDFTNVFSGATFLLLFHRSFGLFQCFVDVRADVLLT